MGCRSALGPFARLDILLAEDNPVNQKLASRLLEKRNHRVTIVGNGAEAVEATRQHRFDLVLMDVQMPVLDRLAARRPYGRMRHATKVSRTRR